MGSATIANSNPYPQVRTGSISAYMPQTEEQLNQANQQLDDQSKPLIDPDIGYGAVSVLSAGASGMAAFSSAQQSRLYADLQSSGYSSQAATALLNARQSMNDMYNAYRIGEYQALLQGVSDSQAVSKARANAASSGVRMRSGSKAEVDQSNRMSARMNQITIQQNATSAAMRSYLSAVNYKAQATVAQGNARAAHIMAHAESPFLSGVSSFMSSIASSYLPIALREYGAGGK